MDDSEPFHIEKVQKWQNDSQIAIEQLLLNKCDTFSIDLLVPPSPTKDFLSQLLSDLAHVAQNSEMLYQNGTRRVLITHWIHRAALMFSDVTTTGSVNRQTLDDRMMDQSFPD